MSRIRVCFLGTPEFAATSLRALLADEHFEVVGVVTQPDRPSGRKLQLTPSPVKQLAMANQLRVVTPESLKGNPLIFAEIKKWGAEIAVVVAYGQILTEEFLQAFKLGAVNVHGSLLPLWRGAAPIQRSLEAGDRVTGVSLQKMVKRLDAGDVIAERTLEVSESMDAHELFQRLAILGADLLHVELMDYIRGNLAPKPQDESLVTYAKKIEKAESLIDWSLSAEKLHNKVRAFTMGPGTHIQFQGKKLKILKTKVFRNESGQLPPSKLHEAKLNPGQILAVHYEGQVVPDRLIVQCNPGFLEILEVQPESRNRMSSQEFLKGYPLQPKDLL
ncbi:MAG: methionyl-tRNA formyltransferase [Bdellovibrionaceae bacterium]|nr:methionyl-tRNA formyltransferase [Pseudobdellovibrionaceae bacterium]